jgi:hypothetical protein
VSCGTIASLRNGRVFPRVCATYLNGFRIGAAVYPYLEDGLQ